MGILNFVIRRLLLMVLILAGVTVIVFGILMMLPPGQRVSVYVQDERVNAQQLDALIEKYGLNDPAPVQYFRWIKGVFKGDFGYSVVATAPVGQAFRQYFPVTLELVLLATPLIILVGVWLGTLAATHKDTAIDHTTRVFAIIGYSLPTFWLGLMLLMIFYGFFG